MIAASTRSAGAEVRGYAHAWRALRGRNFRLFFSGQSVSLVGTWMTRVATAWLVYRLTGSSLLLGMVSFAGQIPTFLLAPFAGVLVDRVDKHKVLVATQVVSMVQSFALAGLTLSPRITIRDLVWLSVLQGVVNAFDMPVRQSFLVQMVDDRADLSNAIAINSSMVNAARLVGPSIAGIIISVSSEGWCFLIDGLSYVAVVASLLMMRIAVPKAVRGATGMVGQLREGWEYVSGYRPIRTILLMFAVVSLMGWPYTVLMPVFAGRVLHGGAHTLGFLLGAAGIGSLISALSLVLRRSVKGLLKMIPIAALAFGTSLVLFGLSHVLWLSMLLMVSVGWGMMQGLTASNTIIQTLVPEDKRGRVMSYYTMAFVGMAPFGSLLAGGLAHRFGAPHTVEMTGAVCALGGFWFLREMPAVREEMRPVYERLGVLKPRESAVPATVEEEAGVG